MTIKGQLSIFDEEIVLGANEPQDVKKRKERVSNAFDELLELAKKRGNPIYIGIKNLPSNIKLYLLDFKENGWIEVRNDAIQIKRKYLKFHTVNELVEEYRSSANELLAKPDVCWYKHFLNLRNFFGPIQYKSDQIRNEFYIEKSKVTKELAMKLGLNHFMKVPSSRGHIMNSVSSKWAKKYVLPVIAEHVIPITDINEMENFFKKHAFFFGRRDWDWEKSGSFKVPAYPVFKIFSPTEFNLACLSQAKDEKTVALIFKYMSHSSGRGVLNNRTIIYPAGWSMERYEQSLTDEDKEVIQLDKERLARLHNSR